MERVVTHPRLICGLLSELDAEKVLLVAKYQDDSSNRIYETLLEFQFGQKFKDSTFTLSDIGTHAGTVLCEAILEGWRLSFLCEPTDGKGSAYALPKEVTLNDFRGDKRISFPYGEFPAEIRYPGGILVGFAYDISRDYISILVESEQVELDEDLPYEVLVRNVLGNIDVFHRKLKAYNAIHTSEGVKLVFRSTEEPSATRQHQVRAPRHKISAYTFAFTSEPIGRDPYQGTLEINDVSHTGFSASVPRAGQERKLLKGLLLSGNDSDIKFYLVRDCADTYGFKIHPSSIEAWSKLVESLTERSTTSAIGSEDLSKIFTSSSYLRKKRRKLYGKSISPHMAHTGQTNNMLCRRLAYADAVGEISDHASAFRFSDHVWMLQEGASGIASEGATLDLVKEFVTKFLSSFRYERFRARYLLVQFSAKIPTMRDFWYEYGKQPCNQIIKAFHVGGLEFEKEGEIEIPTLEDIDLWTAEQRSTFSNGFDSLLISLFDYWNPSQTNVVLNQELSSFGEAHRATLFGMTISERSKAIVYRVHTYYSSNSTGMLTGIYVVFSDNASVDDIRRSVGWITQYANLMCGTSDVVVFATESVAENMVKSGHEEFECIVIDQGRSIP